MNKKILFWLKIIISTFFFIIVIINNIYRVIYDKDYFNLVSNIIAVSLFYFPFLYMNWSRLFVSMHKLKLQLCNPQVECVGDFSILTGNIDEFNKFAEQYFERITFEDKRMEINGNKIHFEHRFGSFELIYDDFYKTLYLRFPMSMSYRESKKTYLKQYFKLCDFLIDEFKNQNPVYDVEIYFKNYNPFHRVFVKYFDEKEVEEFRLIVVENNCNITVEKNNMKIVSSDRDEINTVVNNYIAISKVII